MTRPQHALAVVLAAACSPAAGQTSTQGGVELSTVATIAGDAETHDHGLAAVGHGDRVYVAGIADSAFGVRWLVRARAAADGALLWSSDVNLATGLPDDTVHAAAVSPDGATVFVAGRLADGSALDSELTVAALDTADGSLRWLVQVDGAGLVDEAYGLAVSPDGQRVAVTGSLDLGPTAPGEQLVVQVLFAANGVLAWEWRYDGDPSVDAVDSGRAVAFTPDGQRVLATGTVWRPGFNGVYGTFALDATDGTLQWSHFYEESFTTNSAPDAIATDGATAVVAGAHYKFPNSVYLDGTVALDVATGQQLWTSSGTTSSGFWSSHDVLAAGGGEFFLLESNDKTLFDPAWNVARVTGATGTRVWESLYAAPATPLALLAPVALAYDAPSDTLVATGRFRLSQFSSSFFDDALTIAYDGTSGAERWLELYAGPAGLNDFDADVAVAGGRAVPVGSVQTQVVGYGLGARGHDLASGQLDWDVVEQATGPGGTAVAAALIDPATGDLLTVGQLSGGPKGVAHAARVDGATGSAEWLFVDAPGVGLSGRLEVPALSSDGATLYAVGADAHEILALALDANTGDLLWRRELDGQTGGGDLAYDVVLSADETLVFVTARIDLWTLGMTPTDISSLTVALDATTGATVWSHLHDPDDTDEEGRRLALSPDGTTLFVVERRGAIIAGFGDIDLGVLALDAATGALQWSASIDASPGLSSYWQALPLAARVSPDGARLWIAGSLRRTSGSQGRAAFWTVATADGATLTNENVELLSVEFLGGDAAIAPDGSVAVVVGEAYLDLDGLAAGFDPVTGQSLWIRAYGLPTPSGLRTVALSEDATTLFAGGAAAEDSLATLGIDTATGDELWRAIWEPTGNLDSTLTFGVDYVVTDPARGLVWAIGDGPTVGADVDGIALAYAPPTLLGDATAISLVAGGSQPLRARAGPAHAGEVHFLLGSLGGTSPGIPLGPGVLPLVFDAYTALTLGTPNSSYLPNSLGVLDGAGEAVLGLVVPPGTNPAVAGLTAHHAYVAIDLVGLALTLTSNAIGVELVP